MRNPLSPTAFLLKLLHSEPVGFAALTVDIKGFGLNIQALGWRNAGHRYLPLQDDIASVALWYQREPHAKFPKLPDKAYLEIN